MMASSGHVPLPVAIPAQGAGDRQSLLGLLRVPDPAAGIVVFAHGSGSGRLSPRNNAVAEVLHAGGIATLLADLLTEDEEGDRRLVFDISLLADRLGACIDYAASGISTRLVPIGCFGASTGAGAALVAAARSPDRIRAVVSRGGRPDLAGRALNDVHCPTLLIVGGLDTGVIDLNREALEHLSCEKKLTIVPGATHLFEEPGTLDEVARLARDWFLKHLSAPLSE